MRILKIALLATAASAALSTATLAADLIMDPPEPSPIIDNSFNWDGVYLGSYLSGQSVPSTYGVGVVIGANATSDAFLYGGELELGWLSNSTWTVQADARLGVLVADNLAVYGFSGIGRNSTNGTFIPVGAGIEVGLSDNLSLKTEYQFNYDLTSPAQDANVVKAGINWHF